MSFTLNMVIWMNDLSDEVPLLPNRYGDFYTLKRIQKKVESVGSTAYEETGDETLQEVEFSRSTPVFCPLSPSRARKKSTAYHREGEFQAIKPYLSKPSRANLVNSLKDVNRE